MEKIAEGYFYEVYGSANGRVIKKRKSYAGIKAALKGAGRSGFLSLATKTYMAIRKFSRATKAVRKMLLTVPPKLFGNPKFLNQYDYEQDRVTLLMDYFDTHSLGENKAIVDEYIALVKTLLGHGIHDCVYKFKNSYGVNADGKVVFIDFNEVVFTKKEALVLARKERWRTEAQYRKFPEGELKAYIGQRLGEACSTQSIESLWKR